MFIPALLTKISENVTSRVNAAIGRARKNAAAYDVRRVGVAEHITEALYDNHWYKVREENLPRKVLRDQIQCIDRGEPIELIFPIFSRKPFCPLKNRGPYPDLGEIYSLARCTEATQIANTMSPTGCRLTLLADGLKYNRACRTPDEVVIAYQSALGAWKSLIADDQVVRLVNYERWVAEHLHSDLHAARLSLYAQRVEDLDRTFRPLFDPLAPAESLRSIEQTSDVGRQLTFTFWPIATSVNYRRLFWPGRGENLIPNYFSDEIQRLYIYFIASLDKPLRDLAAPREFFPSFGSLGPRDFCELFCALRLEAFEAAIRYVAISLADRDLNILREIWPNAIKLTIHGKPGELHFLSASRRDSNITAQHSTGGFATGVINLKYRLDREANEEIPVLLKALPPALLERSEYLGFRRLHEAGQPIAYVDDPTVVADRSLHRNLQRRDQ
jgi:pyoverdine/dityrosine biosynthesis protein Dit1